ncbi:hypothetical protein H8D73_00670 [bacterium]|nr:hypothetical protein [bacterium]
MLYSSNPEKHEFFARILERCVNEIAHAVCQDDIEALLMIGAPTRGEVTVVATPSGLYSLSDIDLICVTRPSANRSELRLRVAPLMAKLNEELAPDCSGIDMSFKTHVHLTSPYPLISNYEFARSPVCLYGDDAVLSSIAEVDPSEIPVADALRFVHNRCFEHMIARPRTQEDAADCSTALSSIYRTAKLALDLVTAFLFVRRNTPLGYEDRIRIFTEDYLQRDEFATLATALEPFIDDLPAWAAFKTSGDLGSLVSHFGTTADTQDLHRLASDLWYKYVPYAEALWKSILGSTLGVDISRLPLPAIAECYGKLESLPRKLVRTVRLLRPGAAPKGLLSRVGIVRRMFFASPLALAYLTALITLFSHSENADREWTRGAIVRYAPFSLPVRFRAMSGEERENVLMGKLFFFHQAMLLGRRVKEA